MKQNNSTAQISSSEKKYRELMREADDFYKIELLRQARNRYKKALNFNIETDLVKSRIYECEKKLAFEQKVTLILLSVGGILIVICLLILS